jgi:hypothetical protein
LRAGRSHEGPGGPAPLAVAADTLDEIALEHALSGGIGTPGEDHGNADLFVADGSRAVPNLEAIRAARPDSGGHHLPFAERLGARRFEREQVAVSRGGRAGRRPQRVAGSPKRPSGRPAVGLGGRGRAGQQVLAWRAHRGSDGRDDLLAEATVIITPERPAETGVRLHVLFKQQRGDGAVVKQVLAGIHAAARDLARGPVARGLRIVEGVLSQ